MTEPLSRTGHYRKEAAKYHELAKVARPAHLGDFYRRGAIGLHGARIIVAGGEGARAHPTTGRRRH
jgi:hypothetical protein